MRSKSSSGKRSFAVPSWGITVTLGYGIVFIAATRLGSERRVAAHAIVGSDRSSAPVAEPIARNQLTTPFEPNVGQSAPEVRFLSRKKGCTVLLTSHEAVLVFSQGKLRSPSMRDHARLLRMHWLRANSEPRMTGIRERASHTNYFIGNNPRNWHTNVPNFDAVRYRNLYPGIDLIYKTADGDLEYDFIVGARADPSAIRLEFRGQKATNITADGALVLDLGGGSVTQIRPTVYQELAGRRVQVEAAYAERERGVISFQLGPYDTSAPLIIDPLLSFSSYLGGSRNDAANAVATDPAGNMYIAGATTSPDFPTAQALEPDYHGQLTNPLLFCHPFDSPFTTPCPDAFVTKLDPNGRLIYSTYLGGTNWDQAMGIAADAGGNAYVTGSTMGGFPVVNAMQSAWGGARPGQPIIGDAFLAKLNPSGAQLIYSTYVGGSFDDLGAAVAVDGGGNAYVAGWTSSWNFPVRNAIQDTNRITNPVVGSSAFVARFDSAGGLNWSTYLGGSGIVTDKAAAIALDAAGNVYVAGQVSSMDFPITAGAFQAAIGGGLDGFVAKLNGSGSTLIYSSYLGGAAPDGANAIAVGVSGNAYVAGSTASADFPTRTPMQGSLIASDCNGSPCADAFVTEVNASGSALLFSTFLGGSGFDTATGIALSPSGGLYIAGMTTSHDFPTTPYALSQSAAGISDAFFVTLVPQSQSLAYATYLGGAAADAATGLVMDLSGNVAVVGSTSSTNFPVNGGFQGSPGGAVGDYGVASGDAFIARFSTVDDPPAPGGGPAALNPGGTVNGASFVNGAAVAPGSIVSAFGANLGSVSSASTIPLPTTLGVSRAELGSVPAPLFYTSPGQINFQVPWELQGQSQTSIAVDAAGSASAPQTVRLATYAPGIFTINQAGTGQGAVLIGNSSDLAAPANSIPGRISRPAQRGEFLSIYCTGLGPVNNQPLSGMPPPAGPTADTTTSPTVLIGGASAPVSFSGLAPGFVGLYQVNILVPPDAPSGDAVSLVIIIGGVESNTVTVAIN